MRQFADDVIPGEETITYIVQMSEWRFLYNITEHVCGMFTSTSQGFCKVINETAP
jgi:hypothetical protein